MISPPSSIISPVAGTMTGASMTVLRPLASMTSMVSGSTSISMSSSAWRCFKPAAGDLEFLILELRRHSAYG